MPRKIGKLIEKENKDPKLDDLCIELLISEELTKELKKAAVAIEDCLNDSSSLYTVIESVRPELRLLINFIKTVTR